jgi:Pyridoxamine 5'-phosphate oxidase
MDQKNLADLYGLDAIPWSRALGALESGAPQNRTPFLATVRADGRPHVAGVGALWDSGKLYFVSGSGTRKSRNLTQNANCVISMSLTGIEPGRRGRGRTGDGRQNAPATRQALRRRGQAGYGQGRRVHPRIQRSERRPSAIGPLRSHADHGLRGADGRAGRRHAVALRRLTAVSARVLPVRISRPIGGN